MTKSGGKYRQRLIIKNAFMFFDPFPFSFRSSPFTLLTFVCIFAAAFLSCSRPHFTFAFCSDIHYGCNSGAALIEANRTALRRQLDSCDFLVVGGDLTCNGTGAEFEQLHRELQPLGKRLYVLRGNHDFPETDGAHDSAFHVRYFGGDTGSYFLEHRGAGLLFLDVSDRGKATVTVRDMTIRWLEQTATRIPAAMPLIVCSHYPLHPAAPQYAVQGSERLFSILDGKNVLAFFSGHYHGWWKGERNGVPFFTAGTLLANMENHDGSRDHGFYRVTIDGRKLAVSVVPLADTAEKKISP